MDLLKFLPYTKLTIRTTKSPEEVVNLLQAHLNNNPAFFEGYVDDYKFDIHKKMSRFERNSFVPIIKGNIDRYPWGTEIRLTIRLHLAVAIFLLWFSIGTLSIIIKSILSLNFLPLLVFGIFLLMGLLFSQIYISEADQAIKTLKKLFS